MLRHRFFLGLNQENSLKSQDSMALSSLLGLVSIYFMVMLCQNTHR